MCWAMASSHLHFLSQKEVWRTRFGVKVCLWGWARVAWVSSRFCGADWASSVFRHSSDFLEKAEPCAAATLVTTPHQLIGWCIVLYTLTWSVYELEPCGSDKWRKILDVCSFLSVCRTHGVDHEDSWLSSLGSHQMTEGKNHGVLESY